MANVERKEIFDVEINKFFDVIIDYESYPDFVDGVSAIEVLEFSPEEAKVRYFINLIKKFSYTLKMYQERPRKVSWELLDGDLFKKNNGSWSLKELGEGKTEVTYALDVEFKIFAPKMVVNKLVGHNLPAMMKAWHERVKGI